MDVQRMKAELVGEVIGANLITHIERRWDRIDGGRVERAQMIIEKLENLMANAMARSRGTMSPCQCQACAYIWFQRVELNMNCPACKTTGIEILARAEWTNGRWVAGESK